MTDNLKALLSKLPRSITSKIVITSDRITIPTNLSINDLKTAYEGSPLSILSEEKALLAASSVMTSKIKTINDLLMLDRFN